MAPRVKICGLTEPARVAQAASLGAAYLGFVFYPPSPRCVDPARRASWRPRRRRARRRSGSSSTPPMPRSRPCLQAVPLDVLQLHGDETPERVAEIVPALRLQGDQGAARRDAGRPRRPAGLCRCRRHDPVRRQAAQGRGVARRARPAVRLAAARRRRPWNAPGCWRAACMPGNRGGGRGADQRADRRRVVRRREPARASRTRPSSRHSSRPCARADEDPSR